MYTEQWALVTGVLNEFYNIINKTSPGPDMISNDNKIIIIIYKI